ncbi:Eco57I restriction-modification methylase domain-containing protein [soil metagenome]
MVQPTLFPAEKPLPLKGQAPLERNGVVYTKPWVADLILDLIGYTHDQPLHERVLAEPAAGDGSFLLKAAERLAESCARTGTSLLDCRESILAYELDEATVARAREALICLLTERGIRRTDAESLARGWVCHGDYLLESAHLAGKADYGVGNPPYIRLESLEDGGATYRAAYPTMVGRADIYVAFYEAALRQLKPSGACGFICADRWMFNQYGAALRRFVTSGFSVEAVVQMHHADAFESEVSAYPAVTIIRRAPQGSVRVASLDAEAGTLTAAELPTKGAELDGWFTGEEPWPLLSAEHLSLLRRLEAGFPTLEETGATVGIGVATGADAVFITKDSDLVEAERLLPLAMASDVRGASLAWSGHYLVNPWNGAGLINLAAYPRLADYLDRHRIRLQARHVGKKNPHGWYRTIDRVNGTLTAIPKLYLPDFKGRIAPILDRGGTYPHHNLYFILPGGWDPEVLGGLLLTDVAQFFIESYGVRMRGGYLRFQAQYLRRIRVPRPTALSESQAERLRQAFQQRNVPLANAVSRELYCLTENEEALLGPG